MPPALDLGVAGGVLPLSCGNSPVIFLVVPSLLRCVCVEVPAPVLVHGGLYSPGLSKPFPGGARPPEKALFVSSRPGSTGVYYEGCRRLCFRSFLRLACRQVLPISFPFLFPAGEEKAPGLFQGACGPPCCFAARLPRVVLSVSLSAVRPLIVAVAVKAKASAAGRGLRGSPRSAAALTAPLPSGCRKAERSERMKRLVVQLIILLQRASRGRSPAFVRSVDRVCLWLARPFFGPVSRG